MNNVSDDALCDWLDLYALDGLEEHEKVVFEYHVTQCALCRNKLPELKHVVELLPLASAPAAIPEGMRGRILGSILGQAAHEQAGAKLEEGMKNRRASRMHAHSRRAERSPGGDGESAAAELSRRAVQTERSARRSAIWRWMSIGLIAAVVGMGLLAFQLNKTIGSLRSELDKSAELLANAGADLAKANSELSLLKKPSEASKVSRVAVLSPAAEGYTAKGLAAIVTDARGAHLIVQAEELPPNKPEEAFQVWLVKNNQPVSAGSFYPQNGKGALSYTLVNQEYDSIAITLEPDAHGEKPRGPVVLTANLSS